MSIKFLKAGTGDAVLIQHGGKNILIDGGNEFKYLRDQVKAINDLNEKIDLLIITHHDDDHIAGVISLLTMIKNEELPSDFVSEVFFNSPRKIKGKISDTTANHLSYKQAYETEELILELGVKWELITENSNDVKIGEINLNFLSPMQDDLENYSEKKGAYLTGDFRCDWDVPITDIEKYIDDASQDKSLSNKTSIIILAEFDSKRFLLTGDCTPDRFEAALDKIDKNESGQAEFYAVKLPHHGSYRSLNQAIIKSIKCSRFIISTNSKKYFLPNKRALLKVKNYALDKTARIEFFFNYEEALNALKITAVEKTRYSLILTPNNKSYGISL
ncbi:beta-lactamase superfamily II metal-dependent hydrolase [Chryseobacterium ginsenosidimutans]|uniref:ComEC/Rec2 family competence protein n=1 Tax=Chryseobacterium ginsenosidimutans TaxID=687846 RepID=UPI00278B80B3|nr:MBL fold metallo-hydrolase [Chryseobacterium ginsenosidimutans]MDQ0595228.1 beta-lactamase superfamily II metal-dependent hydrolase [Chryseobacterium ginsenosidimutans]